MKLMSSQSFTYQRILTIEDEGAIRELIAIYLEQMAGWDVLIANNGKDGLAIAKSERPDAILLDILMPDFNGIETFRELKADRDTQKIPILFVTSKLTVKDPRNVLDLSQVKVVSKPFDFSRLVYEIAEEIYKYHPSQLANCI